MANALINWFKNKITFINNSLPAINAQNLNLLQDNIESDMSDFINERIYKNKLFAYLSESSSSEYSEQFSKVPLDTYIQIGENITYDKDNNNIIIGKNITNISIDAGVNIKTANISIYAIYIRKNNTLVATSFKSSNSVVYDYFPINIKVPILSVSEGDVIQLDIRTVGTSSIQTQNFNGGTTSMHTYLSIESIN